MLFDWDRTLKALLEKHQVSYSIIQKFSPDSLYATTSSDQEADYLKAAKELEDAVSFSGESQADKSPATVKFLV